MGLLVYGLAKGFKDLSLTIDEISPPIKLHHTTVQWLSLATQSNSAKEDRIFSRINKVPTYVFTIPTMPSNNNI